MGNGRRAVRRVQVDLGALRRVSSDLPVVHRTVHMLCGACSRGPSQRLLAMCCLDRRRAGRLIWRAVCALRGRPNAVAHERVDWSEWHLNRIAWAEIHALDGGCSRHRTRRSHDRHPPLMSSAQMLICKFDYYNNNRETILVCCATEGQTGRCSDRCAMRCRFDVRPG